MNHVPRIQDWILFLLFGSILFYSCGHRHKKAAGSVFHSSYLDVGKFSEALQASLKPVDTTDSLFQKKKLRSFDIAYRLTYQQNDYAPFWFNEKGISTAVKKLINDIDSLQFDGLNPENYSATLLKQKLTELKSSKHPELNSIISLDTACTKAWLKASRDLLLGKIVPKKVDSLWYHSNDSSWNGTAILMAALGEEDNYPSLAQFRSKIPAYKLLQHALQHFTELKSDNEYLFAKNNLNQNNADSLAGKVILSELDSASLQLNDSSDRLRQLILSYQYFYKLKLTGKIDTSTISSLTRSPDTILGVIAANLERLRWLPQQLESLYVVVNIPSMELFLEHNDTAVMNMRVVVGRTERQTPSLNALMANVVFNPSWGVPPTILKKDVLPGLEKSGAGYMHKKGLRAFDHKGNPIDAGSINESNYKRYVYKQAPGNDNSLGVIKFNLPNPWDIYLHDTPHKDDFPMFYRTLSSGCIRVQKPKEFANYILTILDNKPQFTFGRIDTIVSTHKTRYENLKNKIPVHIIYLTVFEDSTGKQLRFLRDFYKRDSRLITVLNQ